MIIILKIFLTLLIFIFITFISFFLFLNFRIKKHNKSNYNFKKLIPKIITNYIEKQKIEKFNKQLIEAIKLVSNSLKAGASLSQGIESIINNSKSPLADEFKEVKNEIMLGISFDTALTNLSKRIKSKDLELFVTTVNIARETGGNLPEILETITQTMIERNKLQGKIKALTSQGKLSGWIVSFMPFILMLIFYFMAPELLNPMFTTFTGIIMIVFVIFMVIIGFLLINKIVNIDI